jgi:hypothetical protein
MTRPADDYQIRTAERKIAILVADIEKMRVGTPRC